MGHLSIREIHERLNELEGWEMHGNEIVKEFKFSNFREAMEFVQKIGEEAERENHHPDINIKYNRVELRLTTHDANGLTYKDFKLAKIIEQLI